MTKSFKYKAIKKEELTFAMLDIEIKFLYLQHECMAFLRDTSSTKEKEIINQILIELAYLAKNFQNPETRETQIKKIRALIPSTPERIANYSLKFLITTVSAVAMSLILGAAFAPLGSIAFIGAAVLVGAILGLFIGIDTARKNVNKGCNRFFTPKDSKQITKIYEFTHDVNASYYKKRRREIFAENYTNEDGYEDWSPIYNRYGRSLTEERSLFLCSRL